LSFVLDVAVSAMTSPRRTIAQYEDLIDFLGKSLDMKVNLIQKKTYFEVNELLARRALDYAFICSGAYAVAENAGIDLNLVAVPVIHGDTCYHGIIIVRKDMETEGPEDLAGVRFAFTDPLSHTGYRYPLSLLEKLNTTPDKFFESFFFTYGHDNSILAVEHGIADAAGVEDLVFEYMKKREPELTRNLRVIHRSTGFGMPPIVSPAGVHPGLDEKVRNVLFGMHRDPDGSKILEELAIDRFVPAGDSLYDNVREVYRATASMVKTP